MKYLTNSLLVIVFIAEVNTHAETHIDMHMHTRTCTHTLYT